MIAPVAAIQLYPANSVLVVRVVVQAVIDAAGLSTRVPLHRQITSPRPTPMTDRLRPGRSWHSRRRNRDRDRGITGSPARAPFPPRPALPRLHSCTRPSLEQRRRPGTQTGYHPAGHPGPRSAAHRLPRQQHLARSRMPRHCSPRKPTKNTKTLLHEENPGMRTGYDRTQPRRASHRPSGLAYPAPQLTWLVLEVC